ncbi:MAG: hypothetical protein K0R15_2591 [Clostridiales bacterium]|jgi:hypothetical protein|nr:hypothetical protein [Clostridiales bacterium]
MKAKMIIVLLITVVTFTGCQAQGEQNTSKQVVLQSEVINDNESDENTEDTENTENTEDYYKYF